MRELREREAEGKMRKEEEKGERERVKRTVSKKRTRSGEGSLVWVRGTALGVMV